MVCSLRQGDSYSQEEAKLFALHYKKVSDYKNGSRFRNVVDHDNFFYTLLVDHVGNGLARRGE